MFTSPNYYSGGNTVYGPCSVCDTYFSDLEDFDSHLRDHYSQAQDHHAQAQASSQYVSEVHESYEWGQSLLAHCMEVYDNLKRHVFSASMTVHSRPEPNPENTYWVMSREWWHEIRTHVRDGFGNAPWAGVIAGTETLIGFPVRHESGSDIPELVYNQSQGQQLDYLQKPMTAAEAQASYGIGLPPAIQVEDLKYFAENGSFPVRPAKPGEIGMQGMSPGITIYDEIMNYKPDENPFQIAKPNPTWHWDGKPIVGFQGWSGTV